MLVALLADVARFCNTRLGDGRWGAEGEECWGILVELCILSSFMGVVVRELMKKLFIGGRTNQVGGADKPVFELEDRRKRCDLLSVGIPRMKLFLKP